MVLTKVPTMLNVHNSAPSYYYFFNMLV